MAQIILSPAGFVIPVEYLIYAVGATEADAWADLRAEMAKIRTPIIQDADESAPEALVLSSLRAVPATAALLATVRHQGGDVAWTTDDAPHGGTACTRAEYDAAYNAAEDAE